MSGSSEPTGSEEDELSDGSGVAPLLGSSCNGRGNGELLPTGEKKEGPLARAFHSFVAWTFLLAVVSAFVLLMLMKVIAPYFLASKHDESWGSLLADNRCKCVCPHNLNVTLAYNTTVWMVEVNDPSECFCENILPVADDVLCLRCTCAYESRNSILIAVIVIIFLILSCGLFLYTLFICLQPLIFFRNTRPNRDQYALLGREHQTTTGLYNLRLRLQQMRWRQTVAEERLAESIR
ncbi:Proton-transporting V-type ATPase complex assembly regulator TMEM9 [Geodia barretti]|uniref:Proton-transporting V-type ATPase complex assembly regulator TMEM9 n=1 Tax=Geodia barretti TaxID=519541 RepID=A0AA35X666_GEOBA|nr:Proton-transporting V-type ATPase complex assembly regulator TMEM9 [Geodia barretti]